MRTEDPVIAILCSDIHLSLRPPIARAEEGDWFRTMIRALDQIGKLAEKHHAYILCAGDVFDRWNSTPELINFALENLPGMIAIPGQHDLPLHQLDAIHKSAFWTLVEAGRIEPALGHEPIELGPMMVHGFPWGTPLEGLKRKRKDKLHVALIHQYVWKAGHHYPGAPAQSRLKKVRKQLKGYDVAVFGDNHDGFLDHFKLPTIFNCGTLMRRKANEVHYTPQLGLLHQSGRITRHWLDTSKDIITVPEEGDAPEENQKVGSFLRELERLESIGLDFQDTMNRVLEEVNNPAVRKIILEAME